MGTNLKYRFYRKCLLCVILTCVMISAMIVSGSLTSAYAAVSVTNQAELQEALDAAAAGDTITLADDIVISGAPVTLPNKNITLDGNNKELTLADDYTGFHVTTVSNMNVTTTFKDISFVGHNEDNATTDNYAARISGGGFEFKGKSGSNQTKPGVSLLTLENCTFSGNHRDDNGVFYAAEVQLTLTDCTFTNNSAKMGGAISTSGGTPITMTDCTFEKNYSNSHGGAIAYTWPMSIDNSTFKDNYAYTHGGAIAIESGVRRCTVTDSKFISNTARLGGGAFSGYSNVGGATSAPISATDCLFEENRTLSTSGYFTGGGAIFIGTASYSSLEVQLEGCTFRKNTSQTHAGAVYLTGLTTDFHPIKDCIFEENEAVGSGGAIYSYSSGNPRITGGSFIKNRAGGYGGAIDSSAVYYIADSDGLVPHSIIDGAGDLIAGRAILAIDGTAFSGNTAGKGYAYIDFANPVDTLFFGEGQLTREYHQADMKEYNDRFYTNIVSYSAGPDGYNAENIINNYDVTAGSPYILLYRNSDAPWTWTDATISTTDKYTVSTNNATYKLLRAYSTPLATITKDLEKLIEYDGHVLVGWQNINDEASGYGTGETTTLATDHYIRGALSLAPLWAPAATVTYHNGDSSAADPDGPYAIDDNLEMIAKTLTEVDGDWAAPSEKEFIGWAESADAAAAGNVAYEAGDEILLPADAEEGSPVSIDLYAVYKEMEETSETQTESTANDPSSSETSSETDTSSAESSNPSETSSVDTSSTEPPNTSESSEEVTMPTQKDTASTSESSEEVTVPTQNDSSSTSESREDVTVPTQNDPSASEGDEQKGNDGEPKTGDDSNLVLWVIALLFSALTMAGLWYIKIKRQKGIER